ncbi:MAG: DUF1697 domain-containing protein [Solirubrobacteraceae bacterium]
MRQIVLLRGINLGSRNRIAMGQLRELPAGAGFAGARTYLQSGNVVLCSDAPPEQLARECEQRIAAQFGFDVAVIVRTREELRAVVQRNPLREVAIEPKRYQVTFLASEPDPELVGRISALALGAERLVAIGRELYAWHPDGIGRSKLSAKLAGSTLGVTATARNWTTVTNLLAMADD